MIVLNDGKKMVIVDLSDIIFCKSEGNYTQIYLKSGKILLLLSLKKIQSALSAKHFFRCHNSYIINILHIKVYRFKDNNVLLSNEISVPVSYRKGKYLRKYLKNQLLCLSTHS